MARPKELIFKIVISDPKTGKAIQIESKDSSLLGKKIGDIVDATSLGLEGYKIKITGGSGFEGAPMVPFVEGAVKKYIWWKVDKRTRVKKLVRGNTISEEITQINAIIVEYGQKPFEEYYKEFKEKKSQESQ